MTNIGGRHPAQGNVAERSFEEEVFEHILLGVVKSLFAF
jgi:hypothetical protein